METFVIGTGPRKAWKNGGWRGPVPKGFDPVVTMKQFAPNFISGINRLKPLVEEEANHLNAIYNQLNGEICKDKMIRRMFRKT